MLTVKKGLRPGDKIYHLFGMKEVLVRGEKESFLIRVEKIMQPAMEYRKDK